MNATTTLDPEFVEVFVQECTDLLDTLEPVIVGFGDLTQEGPILASEEALAKGIQESFRLFHTIKGNAAYLELTHLSTTAHAAEDLLAQVRAQTRPLSAEDVDLLCKTCDFMRSGLEQVVERQHDHDLAEDSVTLIQGFRTLLAEANAPVAPQADSTTTQVSVVAPAAESLDPEPQAAAPAAASSGPKRHDLRVDLEKIDAFTNLIGELVIVKNMLVQSPDLEGLELEHFPRAAQEMGKIVRELQDIAMSIRMIPVSGLFNRMSRVVRDLSRQFAKPVQFATEGGETEMDKSMVEKISDPLVHLIRNSMDHGLEAPEERLAQGKPKQGMIRLSAQHSEGEILIRLEDDGRGLNREKILRKALERGLVTEEVMHELTDREVAALIFQPGFSTAEKVTGVSGRGVGMDVVKQNLASINGRIVIDSTPGQGTCMNLYIPLTLAIIDGMIVRVGCNRFILPVHTIRESFQPMRRSITVTPDGQETVKLRDRLFPVLRLHAVHGITPDQQALEQGILILLESTGQQLCLFVDEILGQQQTVIKPLSQYLNQVGQMNYVSGCTIMSNGEVSLILDPNGLFSL